MKHTLQGFIHMIFIKTDVMVTSYNLYSVFISIWICYLNRNIVLVDILCLDRRLCLTVYMWIRTSLKSNDQFVHHSIFAHLNKDECLKF